MGENTPFIWIIFGVVLLSLLIVGLAISISKSEGDNASQESMIDKSHLIERYPF